MTKKQKFFSLAACLPIMPIIMMIALSATFVEGTEQANPEIETMYGSFGAPDLSPQQFTQAKYGVMAVSLAIELLLIRAFSLNLKRPNDPQSVSLKS